MPIKYRWNGRDYKNVDEVQKAARAIYPDYLFLHYMAGGFYLTALDGEKIEFTRTFDSAGNVIVHDRHIKVEDGGV